MMLFIVFPAIILFNQNTDHEKKTCRHKSLNQCWFNVGPSSAGNVCVASGQHVQALQARVLVQANYEMTHH